MSHCTCTRTAAQAASTTFRRRRRQVATGYALMPTRRRATLRSTAHTQVWAAQTFAWHQKKPLSKRWSSFSLISARPVPACRVSSILPATLSQTLPRPAHTLLRVLRKHSSCSWNLAHVCLDLLRFSLFFARRRSAASMASSWFVYCKASARRAVLTAHPSPVLRPRPSSSPRLRRLQRSHRACKNGTGATNTRRQSSRLYRFFDPTVHSIMWPQWFCGCAWSYVPARRNMWHACNMRTPSTNVRGKL